VEEKIRFTFRRYERISKDREFKRVFQEGKSVAGNSIVIYYLENNLGFPRAGFIVSKKVSKRSVDRNRAKRLMREVFRLNKHKLKPFDLVFIARRCIIGLKFRDVEEEFSRLAEMAGLLKEKP
jgi:ribonuclease P protein component